MCLTIFYVVYINYRERIYLRRSGAKLKRKWRVHSEIGAAMDRLTARTDPYTYNLILFGAITLYAHILQTGNRRRSYHHDEP